MVGIAFWVVGGGVQTWLACSRHCASIQFLVSESFFLYMDPLINGRGPRFHPQVSEIGLSMGPCQCTILRRILICTMRNTNGMATTSRHLPQSIIKECMIRLLKGNKRAQIMSTATAKC